MINKEARQWFLCAGCEGRFSRGGEAWMLENGLQGDGQYHLLSAVASGNLLDRSACFYQTDGVAGIDHGKIEYFAASVFWRAAATEWRNWHGRIELGPYLEHFRRYLLGQSDAFPSNSLLQVVLAGPEVESRFMTFPESYRDGGICCQWFVLPGVIFKLSLGQHIPLELRQTSFAPSGRVVEVSDRPFEELRILTGKVQKKAQHKGKLSSFLKGPDPRLRN